MFTAGEYKGIWTVERKWTDDLKLKAEFKHVNEEADLNNELVEEFLQESVIMRQLDHPNVLSLFGVSVHNNKPCVILPLMVNGDLRNYLRSSGSVSL